MTKLDGVRRMACGVYVTWAAVACTQPQSLGIPGRDGGPRPTEPSQDGMTPRNFRMDSKRVGAKAPPTTLIAEDGTKCVVSEKKFRDTNVGDEAWCEWRVR